jgi:hypothetical protein
MKNILPDQIKKPVLLLPLIFFGIVLLIIPPRTDDIWWRLHYGKKITQNKKITTTNLDSYTNSEKKWVNHGWGYDFLTYNIKRTLGFSFLSFLHLLILGFLFFSVVKLKNYYDLLWAIPSLFLILGHHALRPYVFGDLFLVIMVKTIFAFKNKELPLFIYPLIFLFFLFWFNFHGSSVAGFLLLGGLIFPLPGYLGKNLFSIKQSIFICFLAFIPGFLTPHGLDLWVLSFKYLTGQFKFLSLLQEWGKPNLIQYVFYFIYILSMGYIFYKNKIKLRYKLIFVGLAVVSFRSTRNLPLFVLISPLLLELKSEFTLNFKRRLVLFGFFSGVILSVYLVINNKPFKSKFYPKKLYIETQKTIEKTKVINVFTTHYWGGAQIYHFNGKLKTYIDARNDCYDSEVFDNYDIIVKMKKGWYDKLLVTQPDLIILPHGHKLINALIDRRWILKINHPEGVVLTHLPSK